MHGRGALRFVALSGSGAPLVWLRQPGALFLAALPYRNRHVTPRGHTCPVRNIMCTHQPSTLNIFRPECFSQSFG